MHCQHVSHSLEFGERGPVEWLRLRQRRVCGELLGMLSVLRVLGVLPVLRVRRVEGAIWVRCVRVWRCWICVLRHGDDDGWLAYRAPQPTLSRGGGESVDARRARYLGTVSSEQHSRWYIALARLNPVAVRSFPHATAAPRHHRVPSLCHSVRVVTTRWIPCWRSRRSGQREVQNTALRPCIHKLAETPSNLHRCRPLGSQRINLLAFDKNDLVLRVFPVIDLIRHSIRYDSKLRVTTLCFCMVRTALESLLRKPSKHMLIDFARKLA
jgi:hypothetical protein